MTIQRALYLDCLCEFLFVVCCQQISKSTVRLPIDNSTKPHKRNCDACLPRKKHTPLIFDFVEKKTRKKKTKDSKFSPLSDLV